MHCCNCLLNGYIDSVWINVLLIYSDHCIHSNNHVPWFVCTLTVHYVQNTLPNMGSRVGATDVLVDPALAVIQTNIHYSNAERSHSTHYTHCMLTMSVKCFVTACRRCRNWCVGVCRMCASNACLQVITWALSIPFSNAMFGISCLHDSQLTLLRTK